MDSGRFRSWVGSGGRSDLFPIFLQMDIWDFNANPHPLNLTLTWWGRCSCVKYVHGDGQCTMKSFLEIFIKIKSFTKWWVKKTFKGFDATLLCTENIIDKLYRDSPNVWFSEEIKVALATLEREKGRLLAWQEAKWRIKSRATWLKEGDENTKFFQSHAKRRKEQNTIWKITNVQRLECTIFDDI
jgi:hypothetical protein